MKVFGCFLLIFLLRFTSFATILVDLPKHETFFNFQIGFYNSRLETAFYALQAWKKAIYSDPNNFTSNWIGPDVCSYNGIFCEQALDDSNLKVVAGIDLNHGDISGHLPDEIGNFGDIGILHLNSNRFSGIVPESIAKLKILYELDLSNNRFTGTFPNVVLGLPELKYLDLRFNDFVGALPPGLFDKELDAIFINNNRFYSTISDNFGNSPASVVVLANNMLKGCIPRSIGQMAGKLEELILSNNELSGCLPEEISLLNSTTVFDISNNRFVGDLPKDMDYLQSVEIVNIAINRFRSKIPQTVCTLPKLKNFSFSSNYFDAKDPACNANVLPGLFIDDKINCFAKENYQRSYTECQKVLSERVDCGTGCRAPQYGESPKSKPPKEDTTITPTPVAYTPELAPTPEVSPSIANPPYSEPPQVVVPDQPTHTPNTRMTNDPSKPNAQPPKVYSQPPIVEPLMIFPPNVSNPPKSCTTPETVYSPLKSAPAPALSHNTNPSISPPPPSPPQFPPPPFYSPPPPHVHSPPPRIQSPTPSHVHSPPPPPIRSPPPPVYPPPLTVQSQPPPPQRINSPPPPSLSLTPHMNPPPPRTPQLTPPYVLPPILGANYQSPPPPSIPGY